MSGGMARVLLAVLAAMVVNVSCYRGGNRRAKLMEMEHKDQQRRPVSGREGKRESRHRGLLYTV